MASQTQRTQGRFQRTRQGRSEEPDEDAGRTQDADGDAANGEDADGGTGMDEGDAEIRRKANDLVRLALFTEQRRIPLRREEISKKGISSDILQKTFGMELVELTRPEIDTDATNADDELSQARNATGIKKKAASLGSKTYILRSVLHPIIIEHAALTDEQILEEESANALSDDDDDVHIPRFYGSIISWSSADQLGAIGILYTILSLILVNGRVLSDAELWANLKRLSLPSTGHVDFTAHSIHKTLGIEAYLSNLLRQGYLDRVQVGDVKKGAKGKGSKRTRVTQGDEDSGTSFEWRWGSRSQSEVGEKGVAKFIAEFMVGDLTDDDEEEQGRGERDNTAAKLNKITKGIERAAGGQLLDIK